MRLNIGTIGCVLVHKKPVFYLLYSCKILIIQGCFEKILANSQLQFAEYGPALGQLWDPASDWHAWADSGTLYISYFK